MRFFKPIGFTSQFVSLFMDNLSHICTSVVAPFLYKMNGHGHFTSFHVAENIVRI